MTVFRPDFVSATRWMVQANFFASQSLSNRAQDLGRTKDGVDQAISAVQAATSGLDAIGQLTQQARRACAGSTQHQ